MNNLHLTEKDIARFWRKVIKGEGCWTWTYLYTTSALPNRPTFHIKGHSTSAARIMWQLTNGPLPDKLYVLHRCDNDQCVNPEHLFVGTQKDNMQDASRKGRMRGRVRLHDDRKRVRTSNRQSAYPFMPFTIINGTRTVLHGKDDKTD